MGEFPPDVGGRAYCPGRVVPPSTGWWWWWVVGGIQCVTISSFQSKRSEAIWLIIILPDCNRKLF